MEIDATHIPGPKNARAPNHFMQAQLMYDAAKAKGIPTTLVMFEGEQHGFRQATNIQLALDGELHFYSKVL
jgi:dipeptidyl aminopeptidase/acylaminoacyl peptidase